MGSLVANKLNFLLIIFCHKAASKEQFLITSEKTEGNSGKRKPRNVSKTSWEYSE